MTLRRTRCFAALCNRWRSAIPQAASTGPNPGRLGCSSPSCWQRLAYWLCCSFPARSWWSLQWRRRWPSGYCGPRAGPFSKKIGSASLSGFARREQSAMHRTESLHEAILRPLPLAVAERGMAFHEELELKERADLPCLVRRRGEQAAQGRFVAAMPGQNPAVHLHHATALVEFAEEKVSGSQSGLLEGQFA